MRSLLAQRRRAAEKFVGRPVSPAGVSRVRTREKRRRQTFLRVFLLASAIAHLSYGVLFLILDAERYFPLLVVAGIEAVVLVAFAWVARSHELFVGAASQGASIPAVLAYISAFSADAGIGSLLLLGVLGVFVFIPDTRPILRVEVGLALVIVVVFEEVFFTRERAWAPLSAEATHVFATVNRVMLVGGLFVLAVVIHRRSMVHARIIEGAQLYAERLAETDQLTGLANRRPLVVEMRRLSSKRDVDIAVAIADIDLFKKFNDEHGHGCGDAALRYVASQLQESVRSGDIVGRWGGEEFVFILHGIDEALAAHTLDRVRAAVAKSTFECMGKSHHLTISIGVAAVEAGVTMQESLRRADAALYAAKAGGRNRVYAYSDADELSAVPASATGAIKPVTNSE